MAWYDQLITDIKAFTAVVATDVKAILPRLLPAGGTDGQTLVKDGSANYATKWATAASGNSNLPVVNGDFINGMLQGTDDLISCYTNGGMGSRQAFCHRIIASRSHVVGGITFQVYRTGGVYNPEPYSNAVAIFDLAGNPLAKAECSAEFMNSTGWKKIYFAAPVTLTMGQQYILAVLGTGDNIPAFMSALGNGNINYNTGSILRCFRKVNVNNLASQLNFSVDTFPVGDNDNRIYLGIIPPA